MGRTAQLGIVFVCSVLLTGWIAWKWLLAPDASDGDAAPGFSLRRPRDLLTVLLILLVTVVGGVGYVGFKLVQPCV